MKTKVKKFYRIRLHDIIHDSATGKNYHTEYELEDRIPELPRALHLFRIHAGTGPYKFELLRVTETERRVVVRKAARKTPS